MLKDNSQPSASRGRASGQPLAHGRPGTLHTRHWRMGTLHTWHWRFGTLHTGHAPQAKATGTGRKRRHKHRPQADDTSTERKRRHTPQAQAPATNQRPATSDRPTGPPSRDLLSTHRQPTRRRPTYHSRIAGRRLIYRSTDCDLPTYNATDDLQPNDVSACDSLLLTQQACAFGEGCWLCMVLFGFGQRALRARSVFFLEKENLKSTGEPQFQ